MTVQRPYCSPAQTGQHFPIAGAFDAAARAAQARPQRAHGGCVSLAEVSPFFPSASAGDCWSATNRDVGGAPVQENASICSRQPSLACVSATLAEATVREKRQDGPLNESCLSDVEIVQGSGVFGQAKGRPASCELEKGMDLVTLVCRVMMKDCGAFELYGAGSWAVRPRVFFFHVDEVEMRWAFSSLGEARAKSDVGVLGGSGLRLRSRRRECSGEAGRARLSLCSGDAGRARLSLDGGGDL